MQTVEPAFTRSMKTVGCLLITLSCVTPVSSVFIVIPGVVEAAGSGALICAAIGGFISLFIAFVYAELGSAYPFAGGEYAMVGRTLGPLAGFVILGLNLVVLLLGIAVVALGLGAYVRTILPGTDPRTDVPRSHHIVCLAQHKDQRADNRCIPCA
jgi:amino acid transporter